MSLADTSSPFLPLPDGMVIQSLQEEDGRNDRIQNYGMHFRGFLIGTVLAVVIGLIIAALVTFL